MTCVFHTTVTVNIIYATKQLLLFVLEYLVLGVVRNAILNKYIYIYIYVYSGAV